MLEFPIFPATLLPFTNVVEAPTQAAAKAPSQPITTTAIQTISQKPEKTASLNAEKEEEREKDNTATTTTTTKGKEPAP